MSSDTPTAFFSYSREDSAFALRLAGDLKAAGADVWLDQLDIIPGERWARSVESALNSAPRLLVILSPASASSTNVEDEVNFALEERKTIIPVLYRDCKVPFQLRPFQYVDFRADYDRGLSVMLRTLGVEHHLAAPPEHSGPTSEGGHPLSPGQGDTREAPEASSPEHDPAAPLGFTPAAAPETKSEEKRAQEEQARQQAAEQERVKEEQCKLRAAELQQRLDRARQEHLRRQEETPPLTSPPPKPAKQEPVHIPVPPPPPPQPLAATPSGSSAGLKIGIAVAAVLVVMVVGYVVLRHGRGSEGQKTQPEATTSTQPEQQAASGEPSPSQTAPVQPTGSPAATESTAGDAKTAAAPPPVSDESKIADKTNGASGQPRKSASSATTGAKPAKDALPSGMDPSLKDVYHRALAGDADAMVDMGFAYRAGKGVPKDDTQGAYWYRRAADKGSAHGLYDLGVLYERGQGVPKDYQKAFALYKRAADAGDRQAMTNLGNMYREGTGVPLDAPQAVTWYRKGAEAGDPMGMYDLGYMYASGTGVARDYSQAVGWYSKAAEKGNAKAMTNLAFMYEKGYGVPQNLPQAVAWYKKAASLGEEKAIASLKRLGLNP